jgi:hypothetical protein
MLKVYARERGPGFSWMKARMLARRLTYTWLPMSARLKLRKLIKF